MKTSDSRSKAEYRSSRIPLNFQSVEDWASRTHPKYRLDRLHGPENKGK